MRSVAMDVEQDSSYLQAVPAGKDYLRRRSADIGGLALAIGSISLGDDGTGHGWVYAGLGEQDEVVNEPSTLCEFILNNICKL